MSMINVLEVLLYTESGEEYRVKPLHSPKCKRAGMSRPWSMSCEGCKFDVHANELLNLMRVQVPNLDETEGPSNGA